VYFKQMRICISQTSTFMSISGRARKGMGVISVFNKNTTKNVWRMQLTWSLEVIVPEGLKKINSLERRVDYQ
jgi:hypothetical protein